MNEHNLPEEQQEPVAQVASEQQSVEAPSDPRGPEEARAPLSHRLWLFVVAVVIIIADQVTKAMVEAWLPLGTSWAPFPEIAHIFQFTHTTNTGAAFGLLPTGGTLFGIVAVIVSLVIIYYNHQLPRGSWLLRTALGLQMAGALGNLIDRIRQGYVTDFLDFGPWPIFNLADTAIVTGVVLLGYLMLQESWAARPAGSTEDEEQQRADLSTSEERPGKALGKPFSSLGQASQDEPHTG